MIGGRPRINVALFALFWVSIAGLAVAQEKTPVILGPATAGGGFAVYGAAYSSTINAMYSNSGMFIAPDADEIKRIMAKHS